MQCLRSFLCSVVASICLLWEPINEIDGLPCAQELLFFVLLLLADSIAKHPLKESGIAI